MAREKRPAAVKLMASTAAISLLVIAVIFALLIWTTKEADRISRLRDRDIVNLVVQQSIEKVAHTQESSTVWDEAVRKLQERPLNLAWVDLNLGEWFNEYAQHDEVYILDGHDSPIYAMSAGHRSAPESFHDIAPVALPILQQLRGLNEGSASGLDELAELSPGVADLALIRGRPAILSAKPVVSDSGEIEQVRGQEPVHLSVVYLDNQFVKRLSQQYGLLGARYSRDDIRVGAEAAIPLRRKNGESIGFFIWTPFAPGGEVLSFLGPGLIAAALLAGTALLWLAHRLFRSTVELEASRTQAQHLSMHDTLTGLPNRTAFDRRLSEILEKSASDRSQVALLMLDLDGFKQVNDTLGHPAGDALICEVARRLDGELRYYDTVARLGGDEFAIILLSPDGPDAVSAVCERILRDLARPFDLMSSQTFIGVSIGIALAPVDGLEKTELTRKADIALYRAKSDGRGRYCFFSHEMDDAVKLREAIGRELRDAIASPEQQLRVVYQPVFSTQTGEMNGVEALLRWQHPQRGLITPTAFIQFAEETGQINPLGDWVLRTALREGLQWSGLQVSVNVSPVQARSEVFSDQVLRALDDFGFPPNRLQLEITESVLMDRRANVASVIEKLRSVGVVIALDDFGTGYSSLSYIRDLSVDRIKIDRSFVTAINSRNGAALVQAIIALAHASGLRLTAEGVETVQQLKFLERLGCEDVQGFLLSKPLLAQEITSLIGSMNYNHAHANALVRVA